MVAFANLRAGDGGVVDLDDDDTLALPPPPPSRRPPRQFASEPEIIPAQDMTSSLKAWAERRFADECVKVAAPQMIKAGGVPRPTTYVYCIGHVASDGQPCPKAWKCVKMGSEIHIFADGEHGETDLPRLDRQRKRRLAQEMAATPLAVSAQLRRRVAAGCDFESLPSAAQVWRLRSGQRRVARAFGGVSREEFRANVEGRKDARPGEAWALRPDLARANWEEPFAPLLSEALLAIGARFAGRTAGPLRLVVDATHDIALQKYKLVSAGFLGVHWHGDGWHTTFIPLAFCFARGETEAAVRATLEAIADAMLARYSPTAALRACQRCGPFSPRPG